MTRLRGPRLEPGVRQQRRQVLPGVAGGEEVHVRAGQVVAAPEHDGSSEPLGDPAEQRRGVLDVRYSGCRNGAVSVISRILTSSHSDQFSM